MTSKIPFKSEQLQFSMDRQDADCEGGSCDWIKLEAGVPWDGKLHTVLPSLPRIYYCSLVTA